MGFRIDGRFMQMKWESGYRAGITAATTGQGKTQVILGTGNIVFTIPTSEETRFKPYVLGGAGVYNLRENPDASGVSTRSVAPPTRASFRSRSGSRSGGSRRPSAWVGRRHQPWASAAWRRSRKGRPYGRRPMADG